MKNRCSRMFAAIGLIVFSLCACDSRETPDLGGNNKIPVIVLRGEYELPPLVDYSISDLPLFVDSLDECTDPEMSYVLPDGFLYEYMPAYVPNTVNQLPFATDEDGQIFNGCGYLDHARIRGILEIGEFADGFVTGFIPINPGDTIYFDGNCFDPHNSSATALNTVFYDSEKSVVAQVSMAEILTYFEVLETDAENCISAMKLKVDEAPDNISYIRCSLLGSGNQLRLSVNEPLYERSEVLSWDRNESYIPSDWYHEIADTVQKVNGLKLSVSSSTTAFLFAADIHLDPDVEDAYVTESYTESMGKVCAEVMRSCEIPFFVTGGDNATQSSGFNPSDFKHNMDELLDQLVPIPQKNILLSVGNHDGATGSCDYNGETVYYRYQLNNEERSAVFFDWQRASNEYKHFDSDGTYYYLDDASTKTRYIVLNSFWSRWEGNSDGFVSDVQHSFNHSPHFGTQQLVWFAQEALDMPPDYSAVIVTHFAPDANDFEIFKGIVDAFSGKTVYEGTYTGVQEWQSTKIAVNYEESVGEIIAVFQGHKHEDAFYDLFEDVPCINVTTTGAYWAARGNTALERVKGTATEFAVDVVVVDRDERIIYLTRLGAGEDRKISY